MALNLNNDPYAFVHTADYCRDVYSNSSQKINDVLANASMLAKIAAENGKRTCEVFCPSENIFGKVQSVLLSKGFKIKSTIVLKEGFNFIIEF